MDLYFPYSTIGK
jgi:hypothetical protein